MFNYPGLKLGDVFPAVGILQRLLVRGGEHLSIDGEFGGGTKEALQRFQRSMGLAGTGKTDAITWDRLVAGEHLPILDVIDIFDESMYYRTGKSYSYEVTDIGRLGGQVIELGGMSNGVEQMIDLVIAQAPPELFMLRLHGHGTSGGAGMTTGDWSTSWGTEGDVIDLSDVTRMSALLKRLRGIFGPYGCIQFMHCSTGYGTKGQKLMKLVADATGVPATSAIDVQYAGGETTFFFEGPTRTRLPNDSTIGRWARSRPPFATAPHSSA